MHKLQSKLRLYMRLKLFMSDNCAHVRVFAQNLSFHCMNFVKQKIIKYKYLYIKNQNNI